MTDFGDKLHAMPCPFCGCDVMRIDDDIDGKYAVMCPIVGCTYSSVRKSTVMEAIAAHNAAYREQHEKGEQEK